LLDCWLENHSHLVGRRELWETLITITRLERNNLE
jgi:hypothetical protein